LLVDVPLLVRGEDVESQPFQEETFSISISAHGALIVLGATVTRGQTLHVINLQTKEETKATVTSLGAPYGGLAQVAFEFSHPAPQFWDVDPMPIEWKIGMKVGVGDNKEIHI
jgi:hypothetical protein